MELKLITMMLLSLFMCSLNRTFYGIETIISLLILIHF